jgi:predicted nicotinamide N-methyase
MASPPATPSSIPPAAAARLAALPRVVHAVEIAGRTWSIEAVADQSALAARADAFAHFPFGLLLWDSAPVLAAALEGCTDLAGRRVLELGCGVGLVGLVAAALGGQVVQTDHGAEALALAAANAARNGIDGTTQRVADWRSWPDLGRFDLIAGSDLLYDADLHAPLLDVLDRSLAPGGHVMLSDPGRPTAPAFLAALRRCGWTISRRRKRVPALTPIKPGETVVVTLIEAWRT